eukprot:SAG31_NODE_1010_length_10388_cov_3.740014_4_plen_47_part_00
MAMAGHDDDDDDGAIYFVSLRAWPHGMGPGLVEVESVTRETRLDKK